MFLGSRCRLVFAGVGLWTYQPDRGGNCYGSDRGGKRDCGEWRGEGVVVPLFAIEAHTSEQ